MTQSPNAEHYRRRARELRAVAGQMADDLARENLLVLANEYDAMADKVSRGKRGNAKNRNGSAPS